jgi:hypothetical protein
MSATARWITEPLPVPTETTVVILCPPGKRFLGVARRMGHYWRLQSGVLAMVKAVVDKEMAVAEPTAHEGLPTDVSAAIVTAPACRFPDDLTNREYPGLCWFVANGCHHCAAVAEAMTAAEAASKRAATAALQRVAEPQNHASL